VNDQDVDDLLRRYRPAGPPDDLRARSLVTARAHTRRAWPWATAAAALLAATLSLHVAANRATARTLVPPESDPAAEFVVRLTEMLGGTPEAHALAEAMVFEDRGRLAREQHDDVVTPQQERQ
jgi:signal transduction histidine kinase